MIDIAILRAMAAAGATIEMILAAIEAAQAAEHEKLAERRAKDAARQRRHRLSRVTAVTPRDTRDTVPAYVREEERKKEEKKVYASLRSARKCALPADFVLTEFDNLFAAERGWPASKIATELARFRDHAAAHARKQADWHAAWRNWVSSPYQTVNGNGVLHHAANPAGKTISDVAREMLAKIGDNEGEDFGGLFSKN